MNTIIEMPRTVRIGAAVISILGTLGIGTASFVLSFQALTDLVSAHSSFSDHSWMWAVALDGLIVVASIALVAMVSAQPKQRAWALTLLLTGVLLSTAGNVAHSVLNSYGVIGALIAAMPPLMLAAVTHLTVQLLRYALVPKTLNSADERVSALQQTMSAQSPVSAVSSAGENERAQGPTVSVDEHQHERVSVTLSERAQEPIVSVSAPSTVTNFRNTSDKSERVSAPKATEVRDTNKRTPMSVATKASVSEDFLEWFKGKDNPEQVTGNDIAREFGCSAATGRRWKAKALETLSLQAA